MTLLITLLVLVGTLFPPTKTASAELKPSIELSNQVIEILSKANEAAPKKISTNVPKRVQPPPSGRHSTRAERQIPVETLSSWLKAGGSPLWPYSSNILASPHWSTIIGICWIEQYRCTKAPGNNYWGIMGKQGLQRYGSLEQGIQAITDLLARYEAKGKDTIEELNGYYVVPASANWYNTVLRTKQQVESL